MNCRRARSLFSECHDGALRPALEKEVRAHLAGCPGCRGEYDLLEKGIRILKKLKPLAPPRTGRPGRP